MMDEQSIGSSSFFCTHFDVACARADRGSSLPISLEGRALQMCCHMRMAGLEGSIVRKLVSSESYLGTRALHQ